MRAQAAIGVFDSGVGGLTVVRSLTERLPKEEIVYLGDTARVPYGSKSAETVARYSRNAARFLVGEGVKMIVDRVQYRVGLCARRLACGAGAAGARRRRARRARCRRCHAHGARRRHRDARHRALGQLRARHRRASTRACTSRRTPARCSCRSPKRAGSTTTSPPRWRAATCARSRSTRRSSTCSCSAARTIRSCGRCSTRVAQEVFGHEVTLVDSAQAMAEVARGELERLGLLRGDGDGDGALRCYRDGRRAHRRGRPSLPRPPPRRNHPRRFVSAARRARSAAAGAAAVGAARRESRGRRSRPVCMTPLLQKVSLGPWHVAPKLLGSHAVPAAQPNALPPTPVKQPRLSLPQS